MSVDEKLHLTERSTLLLLTMYKNEFWTWNGIVLRVISDIVTL